MTLNHHTASRLLSAYLDGELPATESRAVQGHLMDCAACRDAYEHLRATKTLLGEMPVAEPPAEFWLAVRAPQPAVRPALVRWRWAEVFQRPAWAIAVLLIVLAIAAAPFIKGTADRLHATEIGVDLYVREHALGMSMEPLVDRAYLGLVTGDADLVLAGENPRGGGQP